MVGWVGGGLLDYSEFSGLKLRDLGLGLWIGTGSWACQMEELYRLLYIQIILLFAICICNLFGLFALCCHRIGNSQYRLYIHIPDMKPALRRHRVTQIAPAGNCI